MFLFPNLDTYVLWKYFILHFKILKNVVMLNNTSMSLSANWFSSEPPILVQEWNFHSKLLESAASHIICGREIYNFRHFVNYCLLLFENLHCELYEISHHHCHDWCIDIRPPVIFICIFDQFDQIFLRI